MKMYFKNRDALRGFKGKAKKVDLKNSSPDVKPNRRWAIQVNVK